MSEAELLYPAVTLSFLGCPKYGAFS